MLMTLYKAVGQKKLSPLGINYQNQTIGKTELRKYHTTHQNISKIHDAIFKISNYTEHQKPQILQESQIQQ